MSRRRYKSYKKRSPRNSRRRGRGGKKTNLRWVIVLLLIIAVGIIGIKKYGKAQETEEVTPNDAKTALANLLGDPDTDDAGEDGAAGTPDVDQEPTNVDDIDFLPPEGGGVTSDAANILIDAANKDYASGKIIAARDKLNKALAEMTLSKKDRDNVKGWLSKMADEWLFSKSVFKEDPLTGTYTVVRGDVFETIGKKYKVPYEILMDINGIKAANRLSTGDIKVANGPFHAKIQLSKFNMDLYLQDQYVKSYKIGIGKPGEETPTGKWRLKRGGKLDTGPSWLNKETGKIIVASDPEYPLGARWIPITCLEGEGVGETGIALHGTKDPKSIGTRCSLGCIRMNDKDVIEVYKMLAAGESLVYIVD